MLINGRPIRERGGKSDRLSRLTFAARKAAKAAIDAAIPARPSAYNHIFPVSPAEVTQSTTNVVKDSAIYFDYTEGYAEVVGKDGTISKVSTGMRETETSHIIPRRSLTEELRLSEVAPIREYESLRHYQPSKDSKGKVLTDTLTVDSTLTNLRTGEVMPVSEVVLVPRQMVEVSNPGDRKIKTFSTPKTLLSQAIPFKPAIMVGSLPCLQDDFKRTTSRSKVTRRDTDTIPKSIVKQIEKESKAIKGSRKAAGLKSVGDK